MHFIGIGGIGTSALARWYLSQNWAVSGSDIVQSKITRELLKDGVEVKIGHKEANLSLKANLVVYNQAISVKNPELLKAKKLRIKTLSYPQALGELTRRYKTIAIAGAHGKSTTTAFTSLALIKAGLDPTVIIGTRLKQFDPKNSGSNFRAGRSKYLIIEACEWKNAFLNYSPTAAIITNIDCEHLDFFKNFSNVKKSFLKFVGKIQNQGILVLNRDDKNLIALKKKISKIAEKNKLKVFWYSLSSSLIAVRQIKKNLKVPGQHNLSNALAAYILARRFGIAEREIFSAFRGYKGVWRRLEYRGSLNPKISKLKSFVYDDYAHHPTEIKASLRALRERHPKSKIVCVFQPHQAERLKLLFKNFVSAFQDANDLILLPIYEVPGRDKKAKNFNSQKLTRAIAFRNLKLGLSNSVLYLPRPEKLPSVIRNNSIVVMMGAGDIVKYTDLLLK